MMRGFGFYPGYGMMGGGWIGGLLMLVLWALLIAGVVLLVMWAIRGSRHGQMHGQVPPMSGTGMPGEDEAVAIARRRLASGEITKEQFEEIVTALRG